MKTPPFCRMFEDYSEMCSKYLKKSVVFVVVIIICAYPSARLSYGTSKAFHSRDSDSIGVRLHSLSSTWLLRKQSGDGVEESGSFLASRVHHRYPTVQDISTRRSHGYGSA